MKKLNLVVLLAGGLYSTYGMASVQCDTTPTTDPDATIIYCDEFEDTTGLSFNNPTYDDFSGGVDFATNYPGETGNAIGGSSIEIGGSQNANGPTSAGVDTILLNDGSYDVVSGSSVTTGNHAVGLWGASGGAPRSGETIAITFSAEDASGVTYEGFKVGLDVASAFLVNGSGDVNKKYPLWNAPATIDVALFAGTKAPVGGGLPDNSEAIATGTITGGVSTVGNIDFSRGGADLYIDSDDLGGETTVTLMLSVNAENVSLSGTIDLPTGSVYGDRIKAYALIDNLKIVGLPGDDSGNEADDATAPVPTTSLLSLLGLVGLLGFVIRRQVKNKDVS